ncbi:MAG: abortive infection family protein [Kineosporiaceae bacterium]|nr:abortive infection family protein [Kineosporiaceae bacterium]
MPAQPSPTESGERRALYQGYLDAVDWADPNMVERAVRVFEQTAKHVDPEYRKTAYEAIERDGYKVDDEGRIGGGPVASLREGALASLSDPTAIREHLDRITRAIGAGDPAQAIGSAKELIESTAKIVLRETGRPVDDAWDLPKLVLEAQVALRVHPTTAQPSPDGSDGVKRILGAVTSIAAGVAELRNRGYGTGHGTGGPRVGLSARHAHLAVSAARLWCEFMLDTLGDPGAPWRKSD